MRSTKIFIATITVCFVLLIGNSYAQDCGFRASVSVSLQGGSTTLPCGTTGWSRTIQVTDIDMGEKVRLVTNGVPGSPRPLGDVQTTAGYGITEEGHYVLQAQIEGCPFYDVEEWTFTRLTPSGITITSDDADNTVCSPEQIKLTATGGGGSSTYTWYGKSPTGQDLFLDYPHVGQGSIYPEQSGTYWVVGTNGCSSTADEASTPINVTVKQRLLGIPNPTGAGQLCRGSTGVAYNLNVDMTQVYADYLIWSVNGSGNQISPQGPTTSKTAHVNFDSQFSGVATISVTAYGCGGSQQTKSVTTELVYVKAATLLYDGDPNVCANSPNAALGKITVTLYGNPILEGAVDYQIRRTTPGGTVQVARSFSGDYSGQQAVTYTYDEEQLGVYRAYATGYGCPETEMNGTFEISRKQPTTLTVDVSGGDPSGSCTGTPIRLTPNGIKNSHWTMRAPYGSNENDIPAVGSPHPPGTPPGSLLPFETGTYYVKGKDINCDTDLQGDDIPVNFLDVLPPTADPWSAFVGYATELRVNNPSNEYVYKFYEEGNSVALVNEVPSASVLTKTIPVDTNKRLYVTATKASCASQPSPLYTVNCYPNPVIVEEDGQTPQGIFSVNIKTNQTYNTYTWRKLNVPPPGDHVVGNASTYFVSSGGDYFVDVTRSSTIGTGRSGIVSYLEMRDDAMNWVESKQYDERQSLVSNTRNYFDWVGTNVQMQAHIFSANGRIIVTQGLVDRFGRDIGDVLPAPIQETAFTYKYLFLRNGNRPYDFHDLESSTPPPLVTTDQWTPPWYYSSNNNLEENVPVTAYPYSRVDFYNDGTGEPRRSAGAGDLHRLGSGHETITGTFPVYHELDDYLAKRATAIGVTALVSTLSKAAVQTVVRDQNGRYAIKIADREGKDILTARKGDPGDPNALYVFNDIHFSAASNYSTIHFYLLDPQPISFTGATGQWVLRDLLSDQVIVPHTGDYPVGFYKVDLPPGVSLNFSYKNYFADVSYNFYDDAGRLRSELTPNGRLQLKPNVLYADVDQTSNVYNHQGLLTQVREPDAGVTNFRYRKDGKIRFSQNARQLAQNRFSYTHYDYLSRAVESGEYIGSTTFAAAELETICDVASVEGCPWKTERKDWINTHYDLPISQTDKTRLHIPDGFDQSFIAGGVSWTESATNATVFSYDELGRVSLMIQRPKQIQVGNQQVDPKRTFVVAYKYDLAGHVVEVKNYAINDLGHEVSTFFHHFEYDADRRLSIVKTSLDGVHTTQRAKYIYYLHGPIKRIELGDKLQGIDFIYNIHGWLAQINHPERAKDPGKDGATNGFKEDAFGMTLDYYASSMDLLLGANTPPGYDPRKFHRLPQDEESQPAVASTESIIQEQLRLSLEQIKRYKAG